MCRILPPVDTPSQKRSDNMIAKLQATIPSSKYIKGKPSPSFRRINSSEERGGHFGRCNESINLERKTTFVTATLSSCTNYCIEGSKQYPSRIEKASGMRANLMIGISRRHDNVDGTAFLYCFSFSCFAKQCK